jgi:hypothetical protein
VSGVPYPSELRLRADKPYLEEGLRPKLKPRSGSEVPAQIKSTAINIKQEEIRAAQDFRTYN